MNVVRKNTMAGDKDPEWRGRAAVHGVLREGLSKPNLIRMLSGKPRKSEEASP